MAVYFKYILSTIASLLLCQIGFTQVMSENMSGFEKEINQILLDTNNNSLKKILIQTDICVNPTENTHWKEKVHFKYLNDSILQQRFLVKNNYLLKVDADLEVVDYKRNINKILNFFYTAKDSSNYRVVSKIKILGEDTSLSVIITKKDSIANFKSKYYTIKNATTGAIQYQYTSELIGDTLEINSLYKYTNNSWLLINKLIIKTFKDGNVFSEISTSVNYYSLVIHFNLSTTEFFYDENNRVVKIIKYNMENNSLSNITASQMLIKYKEK